MWKDFFYFSRGERRAIIAMTVLIIIIQSALWTSDFWIPLLPDDLTKKTQKQKDLQAFQDSLSGQSYQGNNAGYRQNVPTKYEKREYSSFSANGGKLSIFNPNTADSAKLVALGLRPYVARNILKYRRKGGVFRKAEDFARIYGIDPAQYVRLKPYIRIQSSTSDLQEQTSSGYRPGNPIPTTNQRANLSADNREISLNTAASAKDIGNSINTGGQASVKSEVAAESFSSASGSSSLKISGFPGIEVNRVDTTVLQQLKGVGAVTANRITQYRNRLGGFYSIHQLEEINGIYPDALTRLQALLKVDTAQIVKINANKASLEKLKAHPYLSFYQAKVIVELRKARSGIKNIRELSDFKEFTPADIARLKWYLAF